MQESKSLIQNALQILVKLAGLHAKSRNVSRYQKGMITARQEHQSVSSGQHLSASACQWL